MILILGNITFLDPIIDGKHEAIIHDIKKIVECPDVEKAGELGEESLDSFESYLIPGLYKGKIENEIGYYAMDKDKNLFSFEWGANDSLYIFKDGKKELVEAANYEIIDADFFLKN